VKTRTSKAIGAAAGIAAIALSVPLAVTAYAEPTEAPTLEIPDPQGPGCDSFKTEVPDYKSLANSPVGTALQSIPEASTFYSAISGGFNPAVNIVPVLENGPYVVFAPTNEAFAALPPAQLDALKADPAALTDLVYYHEFLGLLGNDDVKGQRPTQQGAEINVEGKGGDITVNDAKLVCGAIFAKDARIYLIDTVLDPKSPPKPLTPSSTSTSETTTTTTSETSTSETTPTETPAAEAPASVASVAPSSEPEPLPAADAPIG
jgi:uncharacterized surface protein with fasciclin (FAS1) repeats